MLDYPPLPSSEHSESKQLLNNFLGEEVIALLSWWLAKEWILKREGKADPSIFKILLYVRTLVFLQYRGKQTTCRNVASSWQYK